MKHIRYSVAACQTDLTNQLDRRAMRANTDRMLSMIDSAVAATGAKVSDKDALRKALRAADFASTRGRFRYNKNQFPIQDFWLVQAIRRGDGKYVTSAKQKIFADYADRQAQKCPM